MTLVDPFSGTIATRDGAIAWMTLMGIPQGRDNIDAYSSLADFANAPADEAWVYACVRKRFKAAVSVPLRVYVKKGKERIPVEDEPSQAGNDLQFLIDNVNGRDMTGTDFRGYTQASRTVWGGCGWKKVRGRFGGTTQELYWLRAPDLTPKSQNGRFVDTWNYHPTKGLPEDIDPSKVLLFRDFNMKSQIDFLSPLSSARYDIQTNRAAAMHTASTLMNRGVPEGYWKAQKGVEVSKADQSAIRRFIRQLRGPRNAGKSLVSPDIEYQALALIPKDAEWLAARKVSRLTVSAVTGVPLLVAGDDDKASVYANFRDAEVAFWRGTMVDELNGDADVINNWLLPEFDPTRRTLTVAPDFSGVEALKPTWTEELTGYLAAIDHQVLVPDEVRAHFRFGGSVPWGQSPVPRTTITLRDTPVTPPAIPATEGATAPPATGEVIESGDSSPDVPDALRSIASLYKQPAVKAFILDGGPFDAEGLLGQPIPDATRSTIEDGLRRRQSAAQIAASLEGVAV